MSRVLSPLRASEEGILLDVRLTPKAAVDRLGLVRFYDDKAVLRVSVRAVPEKGKANKALCLVLAREFRLAKSKIEVVGGAKSRHKTVLIRGESGRLMPRLEEKLNYARNSEGDGK